MKFGIVVFPGSNCDRDMMHALKDDLGQEVEMLWHKNDNLEGFTKDDCIVLPGGFSYGDYLRCGAIARFSPIMDAVIDFANKGGKVLGVCNGFQVLCESGLLPGALLLNNHQKFVCKNVFIRSSDNISAIGKNTDGKVLKIPVAHGEGRYYADDTTVKKLENNGQVLFRYCNETGEANGNSNPNGAVNDIAGICNEAGNVFGMMPHPERACSQDLSNVDGRLILEALANAN